MTLTSVLRGSAAASLLAAFVLSISPAFAADALVSVGDELAVGKNRTGEACRIKLVASRAEVGGGAIEPTTLGSGTVAALRDCRRLDGGWRDVVVAAIIGSRGYGLETFPTNMPLLEASVEVIEGKRAPADAGKASGSLSAVMKRAEAMVDASGKLTGVGNGGAHAALYRVGTLRNYAGDVVGSDAAFRRALQIEERTGGRDQPASGRTLAWIALNVGYQPGRAGEAMPLFDRAEPPVPKRNSAQDR